MTITKVVTSDLLETGPANQRRLIRMNQRFSGSTCNRNRRASTIAWWTTEEHDKFLEAMELYPSGPWKKIAQHIGSRSPRQVMTHAQKYRQRIKRREYLKTRDESEQRKKVATAASKSESGEIVHKIAANVESPLPLLLKLEEITLEPLPLFQSGETTESRAEDVSAADVLLFDELRHLLAPGIGEELSAMELGFIDCDELVAVLFDLAINWEATSM